MQLQISMSSEFTNLYSNYECGSPGRFQICSEICLGTAMIAQQAFHQNVYLRTYYFSQYKAAVEFNLSASDFFQVNFIHNFTETTRYSTEMFFPMLFWLI